MFRNLRICNSASAAPEGLRPVLIGYLRDPPGGEDAGAQRRALAAAGCGEVVQEPAGAADAQPGLHGLLARLRPGDTLVVATLDSLGVLAAGRGAAGPPARRRRRRAAQPGRAVRRPAQPRRPP